MTRSSVVEARESVVQNSKMCCKVFVESQVVMWFFRAEILLTTLSILMLVFGTSLRCQPMTLLHALKLCCLVVMLVMCLIAKIILEKAGNYWSFAATLQWEVLRIPTQFFLFSLPQNYGIATMQDFASNCESPDPHWISVVYIGSWLVGVTSLTVATCNRRNDRRSLAPAIICVGIFCGAMGLIVTRGISWGVLLLQVNNSFLYMTEEGQVSMMFMIVVNVCLLVRNITVGMRKCCMGHSEVLESKPEDQDSTEEPQAKSPPMSASNSEVPEETAV